jgi:ATP-dependent exoDNAse (exonuclease V) beta subunit
MGDFSPSESVLTGARQALDRVSEHNRQSIDRWLEMDPGARAAALPEVAGIVFTAKGELKQAQKGQLKADPDYDRHAERLASAVAELLQVQRASRLAADMAAGLRAGQAFARAYTHAKRAAGVADFNDLIDWTRKLLATPGMGDWVRYKLDREVDWVIKYKLIEAFRARHDLPLGHARVQLLDLQYHDVSRERSPFYKLQGRGLVERVCTDA